MNTASASPSEHTATDTPPPQRRVIDAPTRALHWLLALSFSGAYLTAESERWHQVHTTLGYTALGLVLARLLWALAGPRRVRASVWMGKLRGLPLQARAWLEGRGQLLPSFHAFNALLIVAMLATVLLSSFSGVVLEQERWGALLADALEEAHELAGNLLLLLVLAHLGLVLGLSLLRRQNLALPMISGKTPGRGPDLVQRNLLPLGLAIAALVLAFWAWQWQQEAPAAGPDGATTSGSRQLRHERHERHDRHDRHDADDD